MTQHNRNVVLWSGGLDSTTLLHELALNSCGDLIALAISDHMGAPKDRFVRQARARRNYLKFAEECRLNLVYQEIKVTGSALMDCQSGISYAGRKFAVLREWQVFLPWVLPFLRSGDKVHLGYESKPNDFKFEPITSLLKTYAHMVGWTEAPTLSISIRDLGDRYPNFWPLIPRNCVSSCDAMYGTKDCGRCNKCDNANVLDLSLNERIARVLEWPSEDVRSLSLYTLKEIVRPVSLELSQEIRYVLRKERS